MGQQPGANDTELSRIRSWITHGVALDLQSRPAIIDYDNTFSVRQHADVVRARIQEYIGFDALVELRSDHPCPFGVQPLHVIIKPDRKPRLVVDLSRNLNDHLTYEYFRYTTVSQAVEKATLNCWFSKLDLSNCFLSFPLHPSALPHFIFRFDSKLYQFVRMPFGLSSAPRICTLLLSVPAFAMTQWGVDRCDRYLDDFLLTDDSEQSAQRSLHIAQHALGMFGLVVNPEKTVGPAQQLAFLGIQLDSVQQTMSLTSERMDEIRALLAGAASARRISVPHLQSLIGKLSFAATVLPGARPFLFRMNQRANERIRSVGTRQRHRRPMADPSVAHRRAHFAMAHAHIRIDKHMRCDLAFWRNHLVRWDGRQRWRSAYSDPYTFVSDASLHGFGFYFHGAPASATTTVAKWPAHLRVGSAFLGVWSASDAHLHLESAQMIWCEMFAVLAALCTYRSRLRNTSVLFRLDNLPDVYALNRQATRTARLGGLLRAIYTIAVDYNISIRAEHIPGVRNVLADYLSRTTLRYPADPHGRHQAEQAVIDAVRGYRLTANTQDSYESQARTFVRLATQYGLPLDRPLTERDLCLALIIYAQSGHKPTTFALFVSSIAHWHFQRFGVHLVRDTLYRDVRISLLNLYGDVNVNVPKTAVSVADLVAIHAQLDTRFFEHSRDWCACLIAFFGLLRVGEYMDAGLRVRHVRLAAPGADGKPTGLDIVIQYSKTSRAPKQISVCSRVDALCPVDAFVHYRQFLDILRLPTSADSPLFVWRFDRGQHRAMTATQFITQVRLYYRAAFPDRDPYSYAGHSFRRGGATALILAGVPDTAIMAHGRWSSQAYHAYFDHIHSQATRLVATQSLDGAVKRPRLV